jgi:endonuclease YncB( thermonuclease family)
VIATNDPTRDAAETAVALGVGGETVEPSSFPSTATASATATSTQMPTATATAEPTETATSEIVTAADLPAGETPLPPATETPTLEPTATEIPTETPTSEPTVTETPTLEPTVAPTVPPTEVPTQTSATEEIATATAALPTPTDTPTLEPTATVPVAVPTPIETPSATATGTDTPEPTPTPGFPMQGRTVAENAQPDQVFSTGAFRYTVEFAQRGSEIPTLELPPVSGSDWVVIVLYARNWSEQAATLNMADFQLLVSGDYGYQFVGMDASSPDIARFLGFNPILETSELTSIEAGKGIRLAFVYLVPPTTTTIELIDDTSGLNIAPSLADGGDVTNLGPAPVPPDLLAATVTDVIDGNTIIVTDANGDTATIRYLGISVPTGTDCYAAQATETNSNIVLGKTVYLEREYRNRIESGEDVFARDVWIDNTAGGIVLVSAWMASEGAASPSPQQTDTRFAGWIQAAADAAEANVLGAWATCGTLPSSAQRERLPS